MLPSLGTIDRTSRNKLNTQWCMAWSQDPGPDQSAITSLALYHWVSGADARYWLCKSLVVLPRHTGVTEPENTGHTTTHWTLDTFKVSSSGSDEKAICVVGASR